MTPDEIIAFWYAPENSQYWFKSTAEFDQQLSEKFESSLERALAGELDDWRGSARGCLALCILLDQIPRNIYRGSDQAYASDRLAVSVCKHAIDAGFYQQLDSELSRFLFMPLMHSEDLEDQQLSIKMFAEAGLQEQSDYAHHHANIIQQFGRFPHRNKVLGRTSTTEELAYINSDGAFTGNQTK